MKTCHDRLYLRPQQQMQELRIRQEGRLAALVRARRARCTASPARPSRPHTLGILAFLLVFFLVFVTSRQ